MFIAPLGSRIDLIIDGSEFRPGDRVTGRVILNCTEPVKARAFLITLRAESWVDVSCGSGKHRRSKHETNVLHEQVISLGDEKEYTRQEGTFSFDIPSDAPPTIFSSLDSKEDYGAGLRWIIEAKLDIALSTDINTRKTIFVY